MFQIAESLLAWYDRNSRILPWRGINDPYRTWISEIMLQQTRVDTVIPYYLRFVTVFPTVSDLASASLDDVLKLWEGLGYYSRAKNLWIGAKQILDEYHGIIPSAPSQLENITGIGPYTAGAIASIGYNLPYPAIDGNITRVFTRIFGIREDPSTSCGKKKVYNVVRESLSQNRPGDFNQACMDLASSVCVPRAPHCDDCPLSTICTALKENSTESIPFLKSKIKPRHMYYVLPVFYAGDYVLLRKRNEKLLHGLWCFPLLEQPDSKTVDSCLEDFMHEKIQGASYIQSVRHVFSHIVWNMKIYTFRFQDIPEAPDEYEWVDVNVLESLVFPTAMKAPLHFIKENRIAPNI